MLHIAQPALTKSLKGLEEELEVPLFAKKGRNIVLTSYGKYLQSRLEPLITAMDEIPRDAEAGGERKRNGKNLRFVRFYAGNGGSNGLSQRTSACKFSNYSKYYRSTV